MRVGRQGGGYVKAEIEAESWKSAAYWLVLCGAFSKLFYMTRDHMHRSVTIPVGLDLPHQSLTKKMSAQACPQAI